MLIKSRLADPVPQGDGTWKVVLREFEENIPDLGRHRLICNKCGNKTYPECRKKCPMEKNTKS